MLHLELILFFSLGYLAIIFEKFLHVNKAAVALVMAVVCSTEGDPESRKEMRDMFGPHQISQLIGQAASVCWSACRQSRPKSSWS